MGRPALLLACSIVVGLLAAQAMQGDAGGSCAADGSGAATHCQGPPAATGPQASEGVQAAQAASASKRGPPKVCVYTIALNEINHVEPFMSHCQGADVISVADTGSTDGTVEALEARGASVFRVTIKPWRFDTARNIALSLLPADCDLCIGIDMDDQLQPGWLEQLHMAWAAGEQPPAGVQFRYVWKFAEDGVTPAGEFMATKIHSRFDWAWRHPAHEGLYYKGGNPLGHTLVAPQNLTVHHRPHKAEACRGTCRASYLPLLKLGVEEDPADPRRSYYYGRELMYEGRWEEAIAELERYLALPAANWAEEKAAALRHIADCQQALGRLEEAQRAAMRGVVEWSTTRDPWMALARISHTMQDWPTTLWAATKALAITQPSLAFGNDATCWGAEPHDLAAVAMYYQGLYGPALKAGEAALAMEPHNARLQTNLQFYREKAPGAQQAQQ